MTPPDDRLSRGWAAATEDVVALLWRACRMLKSPGTGPEDGWYPITLGPRCDAVYSAPGAVRVAVQARRDPVGVTKPVHVRQAVPGRVQLLGPFVARAPDRVPAQSHQIDVSIDPLQLTIGVYLGRVDDVMGAGTPFLIYLDGLP